MAKKLSFARQWLILALWLVLYSIGDRAKLAATWAYDRPKRVLANAIAAVFALQVFGIEPALAQTFPKPPDVPAYVNVTPTYASGTTNNVLGDGSATGGAAPADSYELADIPTSSHSSWVNAGTYGDASGFKLTTLNGGSGAEAKFRTLGKATHVLFDDPIRNYGQPGTSHCHTFFGNKSVNAYSTFATLRNKANATPSKSFANGQPLNGTGYWFPCMIDVNPNGDGKDWVVMPNGDVIIYYAQDPTESQKSHRLVLGLRYVGGYDMDSNGNGAGGTASISNYMQGLVNTANAQPGTAGRYSVCNFSDCRVFAQWKCQVDVSTQLSRTQLKNGDGTDAFGGQCTSGKDLWVQFQGPRCWDGVNLWSPGGYKHVIPEIWDIVKSKFVCPTGWFRLPGLVLQIHFAHTGFTEYGRWKLSCDTGEGTLPGACFHTDWMNGWDRSTLSDWLQQCIAIGHEGFTTPHECDNSVTSNDEQLKGAPTPYKPTVGGKLLLPSQMTGSKTMNMNTH